LVCDLEDCDFRHGKRLHVRKESFPVAVDAYDFVQTETDAEQGEEAKPESITVAVPAAVT
jgi:hypothetical protein